jgi:hypothetical protein
MAIRIIRIWRRTRVRTDRLRIRRSSDWRWRLRACFFVPLIVAIESTLLHRTQLSLMRRVAYHNPESL